MAIPEQAASCGARPGWLGYIGVDDVDATAADIVKAGGAQHMPATDIPGVGRLAMLANPQGAMFYVMRGAIEGTSTSFAPTKTGHCHWNELATSDPGAALTFYRKRFGWETSDAMSMGEAGDYQFLTQNGETFGAVMKRREDGPPPRWTFYFGVEDIDVATKAATERGATVHYGPVEVPGDCLIIIASDPQGALFGLVGPRRK
jgi:predicted enzyme related to lactoylglutathione lyase